ncbi:MAG: UDP-glucose 4-epimerase GalE [Mycoplasmatales bacterium]
MKVLIIGGAGYIGSCQTKMMCEQNYEVVVVDNLATGYEAAIDKRAKFIKGDIRDFTFINQVLQEEEIEGVIHFAALSLVGDSVDQPLAYYNNNVYGMEVLLRAMQANQVNKIVFSSSAAVYGNHKHMPLTEASLTKPTSPYGQTKLTMEQLMKWCDKAYGIKYVSLRYFNACGATIDGTLGENHNPETHLIPIVLQVPLGQRESVSVFGNDYHTKDGTCIRDYIHIEDLCSAHILALEKLNQGMESNIFNLGYGHGYSVQEIIETASKVVGQAIPYQIEKRRAGDPAELIASNDKVKQYLGWEPQYDKIELIIKTAYDYHKKNLKK